MVSTKENVPDNYIEMEWTEQKQLILEKHIKEYLNGLVDPTQFYSGLNWNKLHQLLDIEDQEYITLKIDELYDDFMFGIQGVTPTLWKTNRNPIFKEVKQLIINLELENETMDTPTPSEGNPNLSPDGDTLSAPKVKRPNVAQIAANPNKSQVPNLSKRERRASLDLMSTPSGFKNGPRYIQRDSANLIKPPETSTTNVNVLTRAEVNFKAPAIITHKPQIMNRFKDVQKRLKFLGMKKDAPTQTIESASTILQKVNNLKTPVSPRSSNEPNSPQRPSLEERQRRRSSVVGMSLPLYIRKQLQEGVVEDNEVIEDNEPITNKHDNQTFKSPQNKPGHSREPTPNGSKFNSTTQASRVINAPKVDNKESKDRSGSSSAKKQSRLQNLLSNSQSLYSHARDVSSNSTAERTTNYDSDFEDDREYISPDSLTRYYGNQLDDVDSNDEVQRVLDDDYVDFVNVNESEEEELPGVAEEVEHDEDYLFKI